MALMNGLVEVYTVGETPENVDSWVKTHTFKDASMNVSVVDWSVLNNILTGSYDRSVICSLILVFCLSRTRWEMAKGVGGAME